MVSYVIMSNLVDYMSGGHGGDGGGVVMMMSELDLEESLMAGQTECSVSLSYPHLGIQVVLTRRSQVWNVL